MKIICVVSTYICSAKRLITCGGRKLFLLLLFLFIPPAVLAEQVVIDFDKLQTNVWYVEDGYLFSGNFSVDWNFYSSPALRFYGNSRLNISRIDGGRFSFDGLNILYRYYEDGWFIEDENHFGFYFSRAGEIVSGQFMPISNIHQLTLGNSEFSGSNYLILDNIMLSNVSISEPSKTISEPSTLSSLVVAFVILFCSNSLAIRSKEYSKKISPKTPSRLRILSKC